MSVELNNFMQGILAYFKAKNKLLFTSDSEWSSGTKVIKDISKYQTIRVYPWAGYNGILLERVSDVQFKGEGMIAGVSEDSIHTSVGMVLNLSGDTVTPSLNIYMFHQGGTGHPAARTCWIKKIVGVEPILSESWGGVIKLFVLHVHSLMLRGGVQHELHCR